MATDHLDITDETVNGVRLNILLVNGGTVALRRLFDGYVPDLRRFLNAKRADIKDLYRKRILTKSQWDKLYPAVDIPDSKNFDISLLCALLRNVCNLRAPSTGWGTKPAVADQSVEGAVAMIHWYRNSSYGHPASMEVAQPLFESSWKEISKAIQLLGEDQTNVEKLKATPLSVSNCVERLARCEFSGDINFHASRYYPGTREWVFRHVDEWFVDRSSESRVLIIAGNAGMGKSVIAGELSRRMKQRGVLGAIHFCQQKDQRRRKPQVMLQSLARHLCDNLPGFKEILTGQLTSISASAMASMNVKELFTVLLQEPTNMMADPGKNIILLVDALDECECDGRNELSDAIARHFHKLPSWIKFLITSRPERAMEDELKNLHPFVLHPLDDSNQRDIEMFFKGELMQFLPSSDVEKNVRRFVNQADGLMLYAFYFIEFVKEHHQTLTPADIEGIFPRGIASVYDQYFSRLQQDLNVAQERFSNFLSALAVARAPLPVNMASSILGLYDRDLSSVQEGIGSISRLLPVREGCIHVFHRSIIDWLSCPELYGHHRFTVDLKPGNAVLSVECERAYRGIKERDDIEAELTPEENYALQQGTFHFIADPPYGDDNWTKKVFQYACSLDLLHAKLRSTVCDVYSVIEELLHVKPFLNLPVEDVLELDDCIACLRRHPYALTENPQHIFHLLANEAETVSVSLQARGLMHSPKYGAHLRLEVVNREQCKDPVVTKFRCQTNVNCCAVLREPSLLVCGCEGGFLSMFSLETGKELWWAKEDEVDVWPDEERCNYCVFIPRHSVVLHGRFDRAFSLDGKAKKLFPNNHCTFIDSCLSPDKTRLLTRKSHVTAELMMWDVNTGDHLTRLAQSTDSITCCAFSLYGQFVVSGSFDHGISVWNTSVFTDHPTQNSSCYEELQALNIDCLASKDGSSQFVLVKSSNKLSVTVCELVQGALNPSSAVHVNLGPAHRTLGVSGDGARLYMCGYSHGVHLPSSVPVSVRIVPVSHETAWEYAADVDSERVLLKTSDTVYLCQTVENTSSATAHVQGVKTISFSMDGSLVYILSNKGLSIYEASSGRFVVCNTCITRAKWFSLSPNGKEVMIRRKDRFEVWDPHLEQRVKTIEIAVEAQDMFKYIDDNRIMCISRECFLEVWNLNSRTLENTVSRHDSGIKCFDVFSLKREENRVRVAHYRVLSCDSLGGLILYDTAKDRTITKRVPPTEVPKCCKFSLDGSAIVTGHVDGSTRTWDSVSLQFKREFRAAQSSPVKGCGYLVQDLGNLVVSGTKHGKLRVWDGFSRKELGSMDFESELREVVTSSVKGQICVALTDNIVILNVHVPALE